MGYIKFLVFFQTLDTFVSSSNWENLSIVHIKDSRVASFAILDSDCRLGLMDFSKDYE